MRVSAKKKNAGSPISLSAEDFSLPDLPDKITPIANTATISVTQAQPKQPSQPITSASSNASDNESQSIPQPTQPQPKIEPTPNREPSGNQHQSVPSARTSVSRLSIANLMRGAVSAPTAEQEQPASKSEITIDARSEEKIAAVKERVIKDILEERPRFVVAFESMQIEGHRIKVEVPTSQLYEEIMRSKTEILMQIAQTAGVTGMLELDIKINEQIKASRPIKLEDRIKFMTERNENILLLKRLLDMDYE